MYAKIMLDKKIIYSKSGKSFDKSKEKFSFGIELITSLLRSVPET